MPKVARLGQEVAGGGKIIGPSAQSVFIGGIRVALLGDSIQPHPECDDDPTHCVARIIQGSPNVFTEILQTARLRDACSCGHDISGSGQSVFANGDGATPRQIQIPSSHIKTLTSIREELIEENISKLLQDDLNKGLFSVKDPSISLVGLTPVGEKIIAKAVDVFPVKPVVTSTTGDIHKPGSKHYTGEAIDFRTKDLHNPNKVTNDLQKALGDDYDVINEGDHIHAEYDPKKKFDLTDEKVFG